MLRVATKTLLLCLLGMLFLAGRAGGQDFDPDTLARLFTEAQKKTGVPKYLLASISAQESSFKPWAINIAGNGSYHESRASALIKVRKSGSKNYDLGLMQVNSQWLPRFNVTAAQAIEPRVNVIMGSIILKSCIKNHKTIPAAISCYHSGNSEDGLDYAKQVITSWSELEK